MQNCTYALALDMDKRGFEMDDRDRWSGYICIKINNDAGIIYNS
ncbi:MAG TPA: hypothetical protein VNS58_04135 [Puia sp.]|jgi:hypothetical protein|nr:hypothetical protein [Puia sp.]